MRAAISNTSNLAFELSNNRAADNQENIYQAAGVSASRNDRLNVSHIHERHALDASVATDRWYARDRWPRAVADGGRESVDFGDIEDSNDFRGIDDIESLQELKSIEDKDEI